MRAIAITLGCRKKKLGERGGGGGEGVWQSISLSPAQSSSSESIHKSCPYNSAKKILKHA